MDKNSVYSSKRLSYRGITAEDAILIVTWRSNPENYRHFFSAHPITMDEHMAWFQRYLADPSRYDFMILKEERPVGTVGLARISPKSFEISYMIGSLGDRNKGYGSEAVRTFSRIAFEELGATEVVGKVRPGNTASENLLRRGGSRKSSECSALPPSSFTRFTTTSHYRQFNRWVA